ncbi:hypothetical protein HF086_002181 [Spodoptera exigua]|uniref:Uncharacterized protein n=1 Tax=Spodoptera exigua TaxID=7107 RepID=A0A922SG26_SPOEX|nr:hypothetical protein HF086_002181 [Spodoptera exigua]
MKGRGFVRKSWLPKDLAGVALCTVLIDRTGTLVDCLRCAGAAGKYVRVQCSRDDYKDKRLKIGSTTEQNVELARLATWFTLNQPDIDTNICGFYNIEQLRDTLDVLDNGLTAHEQQVLHDVQLRFFDNVVLHWDNAELPVYKAKLNAIQNNK